jgi:hypothetical protein
MTKNNTAGIIRKILKEVYPTVKFSVKYESFSGGNSINVKWEDGPSDEVVGQMLNIFENGDFDVMTDLYEYRQGYVVSNGEQVDGVKYVFARSHTSQAINDRAQVECGKIFSKELEETFGQFKWNWIYGQKIGQIVKRLMAEAFTDKPMPSKTLALTGLAAKGETVEQAWARIEAEAIREGLAAKPATKAKSRSI